MYHYNVCIENWPYNVSCSFYDSAACASFVRRERHISLSLDIYIYIYIYLSLSLYTYIYIYIYFSLSLYTYVCIHIFNIIIISSSIIKVIIKTRCAVRRYRILLGGDQSVQTGGLNII